MRVSRTLMGLAAALGAVFTLSAASAGPPARAPVAELLGTGLRGASGSTPGPGGALYIAEGAAGYPEMTKARAANAAHQIETVGATLRAMMPWIAANKIVDKSRN